jgi:hypothetical protein
MLLLYEAVFYCLRVDRCFPNFFLHYPKPLVRKSFLPNVGKTLTAQKTYLTSEERPLPDNTQHSQETDIHALGGIRTRNPCKRAAADPRLTPRGNWYRHSILIEPLNQGCTNPGRQVARATSSVLWRLIFVDLQHSPSSCRPSGA